MTPCSPLHPFRGFSGVAQW